MKNGSNTDTAVMTGHFAGKSAPEKACHFPMAV
jgi:hypothetical protein